MKYGITYNGITEPFLSWMRTSDNPSAGVAEEWLCQFDESILEEGERLNVILGVIKWEVEHNCLSEECSDELYLYYEDLVKGRLDNVIDPEEREDVVRDLTECFNKTFPNGLED